MKSFPFICCAIHSPTYLVVCLPGDNKKYVLLCALKGGGGYFCLMRFFFPPLSLELFNNDYVSFLLK